MSLRVTVRLVDGPVTDRVADAPLGAGAVLGFEGRVRPEEHGRALQALRYEAYPPMTNRQLEALARELGETHGLLGVHVDHSVGDVPVGAMSFRLVVHSAHRKPGLAALDAFIDRMKRDIALWKVPRYADDARGESQMEDSCGR
ncbi:MAG: molybdenum cofactor biosynthesis protein MoaE [Planctomycetota bacterium]